MTSVLHPKQLLALRSKATEILYGGPAGGYRRPNSDVLAREGDGCGACCMSGPTLDPCTCWPRFGGAFSLWNQSPRIALSRNPHFRDHEGSGPRPLSRKAGPLFVMRSP